MQLQRLFERVGAPVGAFRGITNGMRQGLFGNVAREACRVTRPIAESRTEAVRRIGIDLHPPHEHFYCFNGQ